MNNENDSRATRRNNIGDRTTQLQMFSQSAGIPAEIQGRITRIVPLGFGCVRQNMCICDVIRAGGQTRILTAQPASRRAEADVARATYELESRTKDLESRGWFRLSFLRHRSVNVFL